MIKNDVLNNEIDNRCSYINSFSAYDLDTVK